MQTETSTTLRVISTLDELQALEPAWQQLWTLDPAATPFSHPAWLLPWWHQFSQPALRVWTLSSGDRLLALLPLYLLEQPAETQMLLLGAGTSDYLDALVAADCTAEQLGRLLAAALADPGWQVAHLNQLRAESRLLQAVQSMPCGQWVAQPYPGEGCSTCPASPVAELPSKLRSDVRYFRNAAIGHGRLRLAESTAENLAESFDLLVRFHTERWQQASEPGVLADPRVLAHHREALPLLCAAGLLRLMRLELAGEVIAVLYALADPPGRARRTQYFYLIGHSSAHTELRPGILLTALASERAAEEGIQTIDMLRGDEAYKQFWRVTPRPTFGFALRPVPA